MQNIFPYKMHSDTGRYPWDEKGAIVTISSFGEPMPPPVF
jgi:hypothetical protein